MYSEQKQAMFQTLELKHPAVLAVSGAPGSGKTALLEKLLPILTQKGLKVGVIQHTDRADALALPGTDCSRLQQAGAAGTAVYNGQHYLLTETFRLTAQDLLALFERHSYDLVLLEGYASSGWPKIEVVRQAVSGVAVSFQPLAVVGDIPGADFGPDDAQALADWICAQMPTL